MRRGSCAEVRCPKSEAQRLALTGLLQPPPCAQVPNWVWLNRLKVCHLKSSPVRSVKTNRLATPKSKLSRQGRDSVLRPTSPKVSPVGRAKAAGLNRNGPKIPAAASAAFSAVGRAVRPPP